MNSEWPRERFRETFHPVGKNPRRYVITSNGGDYVSNESFQLEEGPVYTQQRQLLLDVAGKPGTFYKDVVNYKHNLVLAGTHYVEVGTYREDLYSHFNTGLFQFGVTGQLISIPTRHLLKGIDSAISPYFSETVSGALRLPAIMNHWNLARYANQGIKDINISLTTGFNLISFLGQYKDVLRIYGRYLTRDGWSDQLNSFCKRNGKLTLGSVARGTANTHLETQFGTLDACRDITSLLKILWDWKQRADVFDREANKKHSFHNGVVLIPLSARTDVYPFPVEGLLNTSVVIQTSFEDLAIHSCIEYLYSVPAVTGFLKRLFQLCDSLGVHIASGVWDLVPFSFIADWFTNCGQWIIDQETDWYECNVTVTDYCRSGKLVGTRLIGIRYQDNPWAPVGSETFGFTPIASTSTTYYKREVDQPPALSSKNVLTVRTEPWKVKRFAVATSLIVQRIPSRDKVIESAWKVAREEIITVRRAYAAAKRRLIAIDRANARKLKQDIRRQKQRVKDAQGLEKARQRVVLARLYGGKATDYISGRHPVSSKRRPKGDAPLPKAVSRLIMIQRQQSSIDHVMSKI